MRENFEAIGNKEDVFGKAKLGAENGFHTGANVKKVMKPKIDAYTITGSYALLL